MNGLRRRTSQTKVDCEMPFELQALEAALAEGAKVLEIAVSNLERAAFPALERLLRNVSTGRSSSPSSTRQIQF